MKKVFLFLVLILVSVSIFAQVDSTAVASTTNGFLTLGYAAIGTWLKSHAWYTVVVSVLVIFEQIIPSIKWTPANSTLGVIWCAFKSVVSFFAGKK